MPALDAGDLFEQYHGVVYRRCLALLRDPEDAAEAVQDVFERAISGLGRFRLKSAPLTWLYSIATRHCLQQLRNRSARLLKDALLHADLESASPDLAARADLEHAFAALPVGDQELVRYAFRDGMTHDEIAQVVRLSRKTVGKRLCELSRRLAMDLDSPKPALALTAPVRKSVG